MVAWPDTDELALVLNVVDPDTEEVPTHWETTLDRVLASAIRKVQLDVGNWDEYTDEPDDMLAQAALRMAELLALRPEAVADAAKDPTYLRLLFGHRRVFGVA